MGLLIFHLDCLNRMHINVLNSPFNIAGVILIIGGIALIGAANIKSKLSENIKKNLVQQERMLMIARKLGYEY